MQSFAGNFDHSYFTLIAAIGSTIPQKLPLSGALWHYRMWLRDTSRALQAGVLQDFRALFQ
jgi:hypothetical protein